MSQNNTRKPLILKKMIVKPGAKVPIRPLNNLNGTIKVRNLNHQLIKLSAIPLYREDIIFESNGEAFLPGEYRSLTIVNKLNNLTNNCKTIAKCVTSHGDIVERTSDHITELIGQEAFNTLFYALCSVINQEYRIKGILALLTVYNTPLQRPTTQKSDKNCQTNETRICMARKSKRRARKVLGAHVVKPEDFKKKYIIDPYTGIAREYTDNEVPKVNKDKDIMKFDVNEDELKNDVDNKSLINPLKTEVEEKTKVIDSNDSTLQDLGCLDFDENSNDSIKTVTSIRTFVTTTDLINDPLSIVEKAIMHDVKQHIKAEPTFTMQLFDKTIVKVAHKPEDMFHIATKENMEVLDKVNRKKLLHHQFMIDYQHCTSRDEDGYLPIHLAVINEDLELLNRQCPVLKLRNESVDIPAYDDITALQLAIDYHASPHSTGMFRALLRHGADALRADAAQHATAAHRAAELRTDHLALVLHWAKEHPREIITNCVDDLQKPGWQDKTDEELQTMLLEYMSNLFDKQGYNPLMLACKHGHYENVRLLLEAVPSSINVQNPISGNTALLIAVAAACNLAADRGNKSKIVDHFRRTIELLLEFGADPSIENNNNFNVNTTLSEVGCTELSSLVLNKLANHKYFNGDIYMTGQMEYDKYHLLKQGDSITLQEFKKKTVQENDFKLNLYRKPIKVEQSVKQEKLDAKDANVQDIKPIIVENILIKSPVTVKETKLMKGKVNSKNIVITSNVKVTRVLKRKVDGESEQDKAKQKK